MSSWSVRWTVLPNGFAASGKARLSLVASLRVSTESGRLGDSPVAGWPSMVAGLRGVQISAGLSGEPVDATIVSRPPDQRLWDALFAPGTPVDQSLSFPDEGPIFVPTVTSLHYQPVLAAINGVYAAALAAPADAPLTAEHPALASVTGLAQWSVRDGTAKVTSAAPGVQDAIGRLLEPTALTTARIDAAAALLRGQGLHAAAAALPLALLAQRLRYTGAGPATENAKPVVPKPSRLKSIRPIEKADFHQVIGLLSAHPALALALGLRVDVEIAAFSGERTIRLLTPVSSNPPLQGSVPVNQPWSRVRADRTSGRFVMVRDPAATGAASEIVDGMLDLRPEAEGKYVLTTADVYGAAQHLRTLAGTLIGAAPSEPVAVSPRRNNGIVLAQVDRRAGIFEQTLLRSAELSQKLAVPGNDVVLFADEVTAGYRVDVSANGGAFQSLMQRAVTYTVNPFQSRQPLTVTTADEGTIEGITVAEQFDEAGVPHLVVGEEMCGWGGWGLSVPRPGRRVAGEPGHGAVEDEPSQMAPGYPLAMHVEAVPGTLTPLRYGRKYRFRLRAVDLAANSIDGSVCDPACVSIEIPYLRLDQVPPPAIVPRAPFTLGESLLRLVARSDGDGRPIGAPCERHLVAPKATYQQCETHGKFDTALGPTVSLAERSRQLAIARNEQGAFTDLTVPDPADPTRRIPAAGIAIAVNEGAAGPPTGRLPLDRGEALPAGEYVVHQTDTLNIPYLADPAVSGVALTGLPGGGEVTTAAYVGRGWPDVESARLVVRAGAVGSTKVLTGPGGRSLIDVTVPPATEMTVQIGSTLRADSLNDFDLPADKPTRLRALSGQLPLVSGRQPIVIVHAVKRPLLPLAVEEASTPPERPIGSTTAQLSGTVTCHPGSTGRIDIETVWQETVDDGVSQVRDDPRSSTAEHLTVPSGTASLEWTVKQHFGDSRRREVTCRPIGTTRYREYFPAETDRALTRTGEGRTVSVRNAARPEPPDVHSVIPLFRWLRTAQPDGSFLSSRRPAGVRIWLRRPWMMTGCGERLGVVVFHDAVKGAAAVQAERRIRDLVCRWNTDPLEGIGNGAPVLTPPALAGELEVATGMPLVEPGATVGPDVGSVDVVGYEVRYDPSRDLWFADVDLTVPEVRFPFLRMAVVRYQPVSVTGCHVSRVVLTDLVQLPPLRQLEVTPGPGGLSVDLAVQGMLLARCGMSATLTRRLPGPVGTAIVQDITPGTVDEVRVNLQPELIDVNVIARGTVPLHGDPTEFDLVVREEQSGDSLHVASPAATRTVWVEVIEGARLAQMIGVGRARS